MIGLIRDKNYKQNRYIDLYLAVLKSNKLKYKFVDIDSPFFFNEIKSLEYLVFRWGHYDTDRQIAHTILPILEDTLDIKCFPNQKTCWHYDDKIKQYYLLKSKGFPYIETSIFWDKKKAISWVENAEFPLIFKLKGGAGSKNVKKITTSFQAKKLINKMFGSGMNTNPIDRNKINLKREIRHLGGNILRKLKKEDGDTWVKEKNYVMFQKYLARNTFDTRVTVIGKRAFAFIRYTRENDFRASGSGNFTYDKSLIDIRTVKIALEISQEMGFQSMAYDFLLNEKNEPEFCEISYTYEDKAIYNCPGYWDENLEWYEGHFIPEYLHLKDLLSSDLLRQPNIQLL